MIPSIDRIECLLADPYYTILAFNLKKKGINGLNQNEYSITIVKIKLAEQTHKMQQFGKLNCSINWFWSFTGEK